MCKPGATTLKSESLIRFDTSGRFPGSMMSCTRPERSVSLLIHTSIHFHTVVDSLLQLHSPFHLPPLVSSQLLPCHGCTHRSDPAHSALRHPVTSLPYILRNPRNPTPSALRPPLSWPRVISKGNGPSPATRRRGPNLMPLRTRSIPPQSSLLPRT